MRLITWNVNGIKTLFQYHPWCEKKTYEALLHSLGADIICVQETKVTQAQITRDMAIIPSFDSFYSSYNRKPPKGYSGTAVFTKKTSCVPVKAEEGLSGLLHPPAAGDDRVGSWPVISSFGLSPDEVKDLDLEGRATIVDLRLFVLINLYCPNQTNEARLTFKLNFNSLLAARTDELINSGRQVIVVGDLNICAKARDHFEPEKRAKDHGLSSFDDHPARQWFNRWTGGGAGARLVDITRKYWPDRRDMFTCWETKTDARSSNMGTRLDYILVTPGLLPWIRHSDIQPNVRGSDHCPVYVDFHESIPYPTGEGTRFLWDEVNPEGRKRRFTTAQMGGPVSKDPIAVYEAEGWPPPKLAAQYYPEFDSSQKLLSNFFGKRTSSRAPAPLSPTIPPGPTKLVTRAGLAETQMRSHEASGDASESEPSVAHARAALRREGTRPLRDLKSSQSDSSARPLLEADSTESIAQIISTEDETRSSIESTQYNPRNTSAGLSASQPSRPSNLLKRVSTVRGGAGSQAKGRDREQPTIQSFLLPLSDGARAKPDKPCHTDLVETKGKGRANFQSRKAKSKAISIEDDADEPSSSTPRTPRSSTGQIPSGGIEGMCGQASSQDDAETEAREAAATGGAVSEYNAEAAVQWSALLMPKVAPRCDHGEVAARWTVNKPGPNKGRMFWLCAKPPGPNGDPKTSDNPGIEPGYRCGFFQWSTNVKRPAEFGESRIKKFPRKGKRLGDMNGGNHGEG